MTNKLAISICALLLFTSGASAQDSAGLDAQVIDETAGRFPRQWTTAEGTVIVHAPEIEAWPDFARVEARAAIEVDMADGTASTIGTIRFTARTEANLDLRLIALDELELTEVAFSAVIAPEAQQRLGEFVRATLPATPTEVPVEVVLSYISPGATLPTVDGMQMNPPPIFNSNTPAILVQTDGEPLFAPIAETRLQFVINTNWDLFRYREREWYLLYGDNWLKSDDLAGPWEYDRKLPRDFEDLPVDDNWAAARAATPAERVDAEAPVVFISDRPAELILLEGGEKIEAVGDAGLAYISNTESDLFVFRRQYYFLVSGRWFTAERLRGPWTHTPTLPDVFASIPEDHPKGRVRASVPNTDEARLAALEALIPRRARVSRDAGQNVQVVYQGEPQFEPVTGVAVSRAVNSPNDVLFVEGRYYLCLSAVWYVSDAPDGPWQVTDYIPAVVYSIPPSSPVYHVTNVQVYESDDETVSTGYTGGYVGLYVSYGIPMYGTGWYYPPYYYYNPFYGYPIYYPYPYSYGSSAFYNPNTGTYGRSGAVYGPYGGYGRTAAYNPQTGAYARGAAVWDSNEIAGSGYAYNPRTGTGVATNRYAYEDGGWGESLITRDDRWVYTESEWTENTRRTEFEGSGGAIGETNVQRQGDVTQRQTEITRGDQSLSTRSARSEQGGAIGIETGEGARAGLARDAQTGDLYAGSDGNVYRRSDDGWSQHDGETWQPIEVPEERAQQIEQGRSQAQQRAADAGVSRDSLAEAGVSRESLANAGAERQRSSADGASRQRSFDRSSAASRQGLSSSQSRSRSLNSRSRTQELNRSFNARSGGYDRFNNRGGARGGRAGGARAGGLRRR